MYQFSCYKEDFSQYDYRGSFVDYAGQLPFDPDQENQKILFGEISTWRKKAVDYISMFFSYEPHLSSFQKLLLYSLELNLRHQVV